MKPENQRYKLRKSNIHIGKFIKKIMKIGGHSKVWLSDKLGCDEDTITAIYKNEDSDTERLTLISLYTGENLFEPYKNDVSQEVARYNRDLSFEEITNIDMSVLEEGTPIKKLIRQQMKKHGYIFKTLGEKFGITESDASKSCQKDDFDTFRLFNLSILLGLNLFLYYYWRTEIMLNN